MTMSVYTASKNPLSPKFQPPSFEQLLGQWYITHTSSPVWRDKRNVVLTYTARASTDQPFPLIDDLITYQSLSSSKLQTLQGTDTPSQVNPWAWKWRGNGWLKLVTTDWEILAYGEFQDCGQWIVVHAEKSVLTPAVINVYTRMKEGLPTIMRERIEAAMKESGYQDLQALMGSLYPVAQD